MTTETINKGGNSLYDSLTIEEVNSIGQKLKDSGAFPSDWNPNGRLRLPVSNNITCLYALTWTDEQLKLNNITSKQISAINKFFKQYQTK